MSFELVELGEVAEIVMGQAPKGETYNFEGIGWPLIAGAGDFGVLHPQPKKFTSGNNLSLCKTGDVILGIRATIGEKVLADSVYCLGRGVAAIRPMRSLDPRYLWNWISFGAHELSARARGATFKQVNKADLAGWNIPLPLIEEQRRIAAVLDAAEALRAKRRQALERLDSLTQAIFIDMFGDPVSNPWGWRDDRVLADVSEVRSGITKGRKTGSDPLTAVPYLAVANVQDGFIQLEPLKSIEATGAEISKYSLQIGDIVLTEGGDPDKLGRGAVWNGQVDPCIHQNHVFRVRLIDDSMTPEFLSRLLGSHRGKRYFLRMAKQTTGIASINMTQLRAFPLLEPPRAAQDEFLNRLLRIQEVEATIQHSRKQLDVLFASLQQRAFRGEL